MDNQKVSRQRAWQLRQLAAGNCQNCKRPRTHYAAYCDRCAEKARVRMRRRGGGKAKTAEGRGRPIKFQA